MRAIGNGRPPRPSAFAGGALLAACGLLIAIYAGALLARWGQPQPAWDFSVFWAAGRLAAAGKAAAAYDWGTMSGAMDAPFFYPPMFLFVLAPLGLLPFAAATALWLGLNLAAYLAGMCAILPGGRAPIVALATPLVLFNLSTGQNGLLTAGLVAAALAWLDARPIASGVLIGLLSYKPQFGVLLPFFLAATGRWRVFAAAAATVAVLVGAAVGWFGWDTFSAFARQTPAAADTMLRHSARAGVPGWGGQESLYGMLRAIGIGSPAAWAGHVAVALLAAAATWRVAAGAASDDIKAATLATAAFLLTPYSELNDMVILMVPWAFLVRDGVLRGSRRWERAALGLVFLAPLLWVLGRTVVRALWLPDLASLAGVGPAISAMLAVLIAWRRRIYAATEVSGPPLRDAEGLGR